MAIIIQEQSTIGNDEYLDEAATQELINQLKEYAEQELTPSP